ncbi:MAG: tetratricopeptide repeat protein [Terracidiphilus sp.]
MTFAFGALVCAADAQVYQVDPAASKEPQDQQHQSQSQPADQSLGWGSNIQNARLAHAAELALQHGDRASALDYAQRAVQAAPNDAQLWFLYGYAARLNSKYQLSFDAYTKGLKLAPSALDGISGLAQTESVMGRTEDAQRLLKQVLASDPRRTSDALLLGDLYMHTRDYNDAIDWLGRAERAQPNPRSELLLALAYQQLKQMDEANRYLKMAEQRAPNNPEVQRSMAGYYRETGNYSDAITKLKSIRNPSPDITAELAYTYQLFGKLEDAAKVYAQAANAVPKDIGLQLAAAQAEVAAGSIAKANIFLDKAALLDSNHYRYHAIRAQIAQLEERDLDAIREYKAALAKMPATPAEGQLYGIQLHMDLVALYRGQSDDDDAQRELETAQSEIKAVDGSGPNRGQYLRLRSLVEMNAGDSNAALADIKEALAIDRLNRDDLQLNGDILMKLGRTDDAIVVYKQVLAPDPGNRLALASLGNASRAVGRNQDAEKYFRRLAEVDPSSYAPYLDLGDLYTALRQFAPAETAYAKAYSLAPDNAMIVAGGMNAAIEAHKLELAGVWAGRVKDGMDHQPYVLREKERYLSFDGKYRESAEVGEEAIKLLPGDRDVVVYLGYDLLHLERYDDLLNLTTKYLNILPKEPDIPLLEGYVHKQQGLKEQARLDFTEVLNRDPTVVTAYVNRGYLLNDLDQPQAAAADFDSALSREPNNGEAHLGLAYANLDLKKPQAALRQADLAERALGDSVDIHVIRATAYGREDMLAKAAVEYKAALKFDPDSGALHFGLANTLFAERKYDDAIAELETAKKSSPRDANIYAMLARSYATLDDKDRTFENVRLAEQYAQPGPGATRRANEELSAVLVSTGEALSALGDQNAAMDRFRRALAVPDSDRVNVRLAVAQLMAEKDQPEAAQRQIALAWMEAGAGDTAPPGGSQYIAAADVFRSMHEYQLSQNYVERAKAAGAPDEVVRIGLADNYLALGDTPRAKAELAAISATGDDAPDYQYLLAEANVYRQEHQNAQALTSFAQASDAAGEDQSAEQSMLEAGADEGLRVTPNISLLSDFSVQPIFEDTTVYVLDSKLDGPHPVPSNDTALLPPPRSSIETQWTAAYHLHLGPMPPPSGFFQVRNARGEISVPATNSIVDRDTTDSTFNFGLNPTIRLGNNVLTFDSGVQATVRRDSLSPVQLNQNLFRVFTYMTTSSFFNALSVSGYVIREAGPFTESNLHSRALIGAVDFRVGAPWGKTAFVTGWGSNDQLFTPERYENYYTSSYAGIERHFGSRLDVRAVAEDVRAWRVVAIRPGTIGIKGGIAQDLRPAGTIDFTPKRNWDVQFSSAYSSTRSFHVYDATQNGFSISYARPFRRMFKDESESLDLEYPIRFSAGFQEESFFNFAGAHNQQFRPYVQINIF